MAGTGSLAFGANNSFECQHDAAGNTSAENAVYDTFYIRTTILLMYAEVGGKVKKREYFSSSVVPASAWMGM